MRIPSIFFAALLAALAFFSAVGAGAAQNDVDAAAATDLGLLPPGVPPVEMQKDGTMMQKRSITAVKNVANYVAGKVGPKIAALRQSKVGKHARLIFNHIAAKARPTIRAIKNSPFGQFASASKRKARIIYDKLVFRLAHL